MTDLEVFRLSALACGHEVFGECCDGRKVQYLDIGPEDVVRWNPFTDAEQRWECVTKLLDNNSTLILSGDGDGGNEWYQGQGETLIGIHERCPAAEFPARALAELESRKDSS